MNNENSNPPGNPAKSLILPFMLLLFIGSGCAALIYEVVWLQMLQLVIGLTSVSLGVLLGTFMGGMCLGSWLLPRVISPKWHPLRVYALLEVGIGVIGLLELVLVPAVEKMYTAGNGGIIFRAVVSGICLVPPTLLMGATLPAISRWVETTPRGVSWLGFFYGGNIMGAVFGCLLAGFYLLREHDMAYATQVAACINGGVAVLGVLLSMVAKHEPAADRAKTSAPEPVVSAPVPRGVYVAIAMSGLTALGAEVVWTRLLSVMLGQTVYTFSIILAVFLVGLGIGSTSGAYVARNSKEPRVGLGVCQMLLVLAIGWAAFMITSVLPHWPIDPSLVALTPKYTFEVDMAMATLAVLPAAIFWGASFPLALGAAASRGQDPGRLVGGVYAANTVGAIIGSIGFSLIVVPYMGGTQGGQKVLIVLSLVSAMVALFPVLLRRTSEGEDSMGTMMGWVGMLVGIGVAGFLVMTVAQIPWSVIAYGRWQATYSNGGISKLYERQPVKESDVPQPDGKGKDTYCLYMGEGLNGSVVVSLQTDGIKSFHSAGKVQASNDPRDMRLQRMLGHLSALAVDHPKKVLVVACGAGVTAGSFIPYPDVEEITICDIEPLVPDHVAPLFAKENYDVVHNPRVHIVHDDGRHFIRTTKEKFDVITSDPIDPWVKGCAALNTVEYYQMCKDHLNPGGVMSLWIPLYESNDATIKSVLATFFHVYTNGIFWSNDQNGDGYDAVLFGQPDGTKIDLDKWQARLDRPDYDKVKESLADVGFHSANDLLATYAGRAEDLQEWMQGAEINWDKNLRLQYLAGMWLNNYNGTGLLAGITKHYKFPDAMFVGSEELKKGLQDQLKMREPK